MCLNGIVSFLHTISLYAYIKLSRPIDSSFFKFILNQRNLHLEYVLISYVTQFDMPTKSSLHPHLHIG